MSTMYQINNLFITKDLIFDWAVSDTWERGTFRPIKSLDMKTLKALYEVSYPSCVPPEFKQSLHEEIQARKLMAESVKDSDIPPTVFSESGERGTYSPINTFDIRFLNVLYRKLMAESVKDSDIPPTVFQELNRTKDKYKLLCEIMGKLSVIGDQSCADLGYLIFHLIRKQTTEYEIVYRVPGKPDHHERFKDLDVCLAYILKRWW